MRATRVLLDDVTVPTGGLDEVSTSAVAPKDSTKSNVSDWPLLPLPRGPLSAAVLSAVQREPGSLGATPSLAGIDALSDDDFSLALYLCYEMHYRGLVSADWEWDPDLLRFRAELERALEARLRDEIDVVRPRFAFEVASMLEELIERSTGPSLSKYMLESGSLDQFREFCVHRSAYQLKEADPHSFGIPRLTGSAKAAMVEIQFDEYGSGDETQMHSVLFANTMSALGLDPSCGSYVEVLPGTTLTTVNLVSMFALHRRWRAALVGHLAVFEMTSIEPMSRYSNALARFDMGTEARRFYDVHVAADEHHALIARDRMVAGLIASEPELSDDLLFGAAAVLLVEERFSRHLLEAWANNRSSLLSWKLNDE